MVCAGCVGFGGDTSVNSLQSVNIDTDVYMFVFVTVRVQELHESRGGHPGLSVLMSLTVSVDVKQH